MTATDDVQRARNIYSELEDSLTDLDEDEADTICQELDAALEAATEAEEGDDYEDRRDTFKKALEHIQGAQEAINDLQGTAHAEDSDLPTDPLEDAVEQAEDALTDELLDLDREEDTDEEDDVDWDVTVSDQRKVHDSRHIEPIELLRKFDYDPNRYVLYPCEEEEKVPKDSEIDLEESDCFDAIPSDTAYGEQAVDDVFETEVADLREDYDVDVDDEAEADHTHVIIRDYPVPSTAYNMDTMDVMIRVHENYPQKAPDWVYVDPEFRLEGGGMPRKANADHLRGWLGLSWHINKLDPLEWKPLETDLRWYLNQVVRSRLRQGE